MRGQLYANVSENVRWIQSPVDSPDDGREASFPSRVRTNASSAERLVLISVMRQIARMSKYAAVRDGLRQSGRDRVRDVV